MVRVKAVNRTQPVIKEMAIHLRTMAKPPKKVVGLLGGLAHHQCSYACGLGSDAGIPFPERKRLGISLPPVFCRLTIAQENESPVSSGQALGKSDVFRGSIVANRHLSRETMTAEPG